MNRRDLLKIFGAGAMVAPVVSGVPILEDTARIILPPTVEPVASNVLKHDIPSLIKLTSGLDTVRIIVTVIEKDHRHTTIEADAFLMTWNAGHVINVTKHSDTYPYSQFVQFPGDLGFELKGRFIGTVKYRGF